MFEFKPTYPMTPPKVFFGCPVYHPQVREWPVDLLLPPSALSVLTARSLAFLTSLSLYLAFSPLSLTSDLACLPLARDLFTSLLHLPTYVHLTHHSRHSVFVCFALRPSPRAPQIKQSGSDAGHFCADFVKTDWKPNHTVLGVLEKVHSMLAQPVAGNVAGSARTTHTHTLALTHGLCWVFLFAVHPDGGLEADVCKQFTEDIDAYDKAAADMTKKHCC